MTTAVSAELVKPDRGKSVLIDTYSESVARDRGSCKYAESMPKLGKS